MALLPNPLHSTEGIKVSFDIFIYLPWIEDQNSNSFFHSFNKYLLITWQMSGSTLKESKTNKAIGNFNALDREVQNFLRTQQRDTEPSFWELSSASYLHPNHEALVPPGSGS